MRSLTVLALAMALLAMWISAIAPDAATAADPVPPGTKLRTMVELLVQQLDSAKLAERAHAERLLIDAGPDVLTYLPAPELAPSASVREAVKRIRVQLERQAARESAQASRVQLKGEVALDELLREITVQTRNRLELAEVDSSTVKQSLSVDFDSRSFWDCLDEICRRLKMRAVFDPKQGCLVLRPRVPADPVDLAVARTGPYRLAVRSTEIRPIVGESNHRLLRISATLSLEPRLRPLFLHFAAADLAALATDDKRLAAWNPDAAYELPVTNAGRDVQLQLDYLLLAGDDPTSIDLRGKLAVQLAAGTERIVFDQAALVPEAARRRGGVTVRLREVGFEDQPGDQLRSEIKVTINYDAGGPAFESYRTWMFHNAVYLEEDSGKRYDFTDYDTSLQRNGAVGVDYRWDQVPGPAKRYRFVYEAPTLILDLPMDIQLPDIPVKPAKAAANESK